MNLGLDAAHIGHLLEHMDLGRRVLVIHSLRLTQKALFRIATRLRHVPHDIKGGFFQTYSKIRNMV